MAAKDASAAANRQISQMVNFILQEAHEKVNEIRIKTESDFALEKATLTHTGKASLNEEYKEKEKKLVSDERVDHSNAVGGSRVTKMRARDELLQRLLSNCKEKLRKVTSSPDYDKLLKNLIVQGLMKIEEQTVEVQCRAEDRAIVTRVIQEAAAEFRTLMIDAGHRVNPKVSVSKIPIDAHTQCSGGVILTALDGRIVLNQTLDERLAIAYQSMMPTIRKELFSTSIDGQVNK